MATTPDSDVTLLLPLEGGLGRLRHEGGVWRGSVSLKGKECRCVAVDPIDPRRIYAGTFEEGLWRSLDGGDSWERASEGIEPDAVMAVATSPIERGNEGAVLWAGTEPSRLYRSEDGGRSWRERTALQQIPSRDDWSFPPRPWTHHVAWIEPDPHLPERLFVGIELGGVMRSLDGGESFEDRKPGSEHDCHELRSHPEAEGRVYEAAGGGYAESRDGGDSWREIEEGLSPTYCWGLAVDPGNPDTVVISSAPGPSRAYRREGAETHVHRRTGDGPWERITDGLPEPADTRILALATHRAEPGVFWAANGYGLWRSEDSGESWRQLPVEWPERFVPSGCRALVVVAD